MVAYSLTAETFAEYGIGMVFLLVRLFARCRLGGLRGLRLDDAFAVAAMVCFTASGCQLSCPDSGQINRSSGPCRQPSSIFWVIMNEGVPPFCWQR